MLDQQPDPVGSAIFPSMASSIHLPMKTLALEEVSPEQLELLVIYTDTHKIEQSLLDNYKLIALTQLYFFCEKFQIFAFQDVVMSAIYNCVTDFAKFNEVEFDGMCDVVRQFGGVGYVYNQVWLLAIECVAFLFPPGMIRRVQEELKEHSFLLIRHHHDLREVKYRPGIRQLEAFHHKNKAVIGEVAESEE